MQQTTHYQLNQWEPEDRIEHDLYYIENWNILFDVKILLMTVFKTVNQEKLNV